MVGELTAPEIKSILGSQAIGHLACSADGKLYLVPITFYYEEGAIYGYTHEGLKTDMLRKNPHVCFQVDEVMNKNSWRSVICWGKYEELPEKRRAEVLTKLQRWAEKMYEKGIPAYLPFESEARIQYALENDKPPLAYRIVIAEQTGRYEHNREEE